MAAVNGKGVGKIVLMVAFWVLIINFAGLSETTSETNGNGLVAYYSFDEGYGNIAHDYSGNGNDGIIYGATWIDGIKGKALYFDGENDYVNFGEKLSGGYFSSVTIAAWIKVEDFPSYDDPDQPLTKRWAHDMVFYDGSNGEFYLAVNEYRKPVFSIKMNDEEWYHVWTLSEISPDEWYHVVGVYDSFHDEISIFLNGNLENSISVPNIGLFNPSGDYYPTAGAYSSGTDDHRTYFNGIIDEVRIYNRALSESEIKALYEEIIHPQPILHITKSVSRSTLQEGESVMVTLRIENTGNENAYDVDISDGLPSGFELIAGKNVVHFNEIKSNNYKIIQYTMKAIGNGKFVLEPATVEYKDSNGNLYTGSSNSATISVLTKSSGNIGGNSLLLIIAIVSISIVAIIGVVAIVILKKKA